MESFANTPDTFMSYVPAAVGIATTTLSSPLTRLNVYGLDDILVCVPAPTAIWLFLNVPTFCQCSSKSVSIESQFMSLLSECPAPPYPSSDTPETSFLYVSSP